jgi:hypothetical protein
MKLWLDDIRNPMIWGRLGWVWVKTANEAIDLFKTGNVTEASLDHDLTPEQTAGGVRGEIREDGVKSGYDVVCWLEQNPHFWPRKVVVHSMNPAGRARMIQVIERHYGKGGELYR